MYGGFSDVDESLRRPYQEGYLPRSTRVAAWFFSGLIVALFFMFFVFVAWPADVPVGLRLARSLGPPLMLAAMVAPLWAISRVGVFVDGDRVVVRSRWSTEEHPWNRVTGFDTVPVRDVARGLNRHLNPPRVVCVRVLLVGDDSRAVRHLNSSSMRGGSPPVEIAERLEAARPRRSAAARP
jgi:hypothetical protein